MYEVDVIIPTYKPGKEFLAVLEALQKQTVPPKQIILINTEEKYFHNLMYGTAFERKYPECKVVHHSKWEFDHGRSRNRGVMFSKAPYFVMMTQDAVPADEHLIEHLLDTLTGKNDAAEQAHEPASVTAATDPADEPASVTATAASNANQPADTGQGRLAVCYARQLPREDCSITERYTRSFNYPETSRIKTAADLEELGIKTYFCSDVCAAYDREIFEAQGHFVRRAIFNEDMLYAAGAIQAGYGVGYCAKAKVIHSHNYTAREQFHRNFDLGVSQAEHPEVFAGISSESEGIRMVKQTIGYLHGCKKDLMIPGYIVNTGAKLIGYRMGKSYEKLPKKLVLKCTASPLYFRKKSMKKDVASIDATKGYGRNTEKEGT